MVNNEETIFTETSITELENRIHEQWGQICPEYCEALVESIPRRNNTLLKEKQLWTKY